MAPKSTQSLIARIGGFFGGRKQALAPSRQSRNGWVLKYSGNVFIAYPMHYDTYHQKGWVGNSSVYSIVNKIASATAAIPFYVYTTNDEKARNEYFMLKGVFDPKASLEAKRIAKKSFTAVENKSNPIVRLLKQPTGSAGMSWQDWVYFVVSNKCIFGGCPVYANKGVTGNEILAIYPFNSNYVAITPNDTLLGIEKAALLLDIGFANMNPDNLYFIKYQDPQLYQDGRHLYGYSPLNSALRVLQAENEAIEALTFGYQHRGINGVFTPENTETMESLNNDESSRDVLRVQIEDVLSRKTNAHTDKAFIGQMLKFTAFNQSAEDLQIIEGINGMDRALYRVFDFPPHIFSVEGSTFDNLKQAQLYLVTNTIQPHLASIEEYFNSFVCAQMGLRNVFVASDISERPEVQSQMKDLAQWMNDSGAFTKNEIREAMNYEELNIPNMDVPLVSGGLLPITELSGSDEGILPIDDEDVEI